MKISVLFMKLSDIENEMSNNYTYLVILKLKESFKLPRNFSE